MSASSFTILQLVLINETGDSYYRMRWPLRDLALQDPTLRVINLDAQAEERYEWAKHADLLVLYQSLDLDLIPIIEQRRKEGKQTLVEYNDNFYASPAWAPVAKDWGSPIVWQTYERFMELGDGIIVTGHGLENLFRLKFPHKPIHILENHFPSALPPLDQLLAQKSATMTLGWAGSLGHMADFLATVPSIRQVLKSESSLKLHVMGNNAIPSYLGVPPERIQFTDWGTMQQYFQFWKPVRLGIAPLLDTPYNQCRSDIKAVEMAGSGVLPILTDALPYQKFIRATGVPPVRSLDELESRIVGYIKNKDKYLADLTQCYQYVSKERASSTRRERLELYREYLPKTASQFTWPIAAGYHEISGKTQTAPQFTSTLSAAQAEINQKKPGEALTRLRKAREENPVNTDIWLAELRCGAALKDPLIPQLLAKALSLFPNDLRFYLLQANWTSEPHVRHSRWKEILELMRLGSEEYKNFYIPSVSNVLAAHLGQDPGLIPLAAELCTLCPQHAALHACLAEVLERHERFSEALEHFDWLIEAQATCLQNQKLFSQYQPGYFRAWRETIKTRISRTF